MTGIFNAGSVSRYWLVGYSFGNRYPGPPVLVPVGSPHCSTPSSADLVSRWHLVLSKNPCLARLVKLLTVHGVLPLSNSSPIAPWVVVMVARMSAGSVAIRPFCGGLTGLLAGSVVAGYWQLAPNVFGGSNGGSCLSTGEGAAVTEGCVDRPSSRSSSLATVTKNSTLSTIATTVNTVIR